MTIVCVALASPTTLAQPEDHTHVPMDPGAICDALRQSYTSHSLEERIIVSVTRNGVTRTEPIIMRLWPRPLRKDPPGVQLILGPLTVWTDSDTLFAIHQRNDAAYFSQPIGKDGPLAAIRSAMPPIPAPDVALALGAGPGCPTDLPYAPAIRWTDAVVNAEAHPAQAHLVGKGGEGDSGVTVELTADLEPPALRSFVIENKGEDLRIEGQVRRSPELKASPIMDVSNRQRVATLAELVPGEPVIRIGDILPAMMVHPVGPASPGVAAPLTPVRGPAVIVLFKEWNRDVPAALAAAQEAVKAFKNYAVWPVAVLDVSQTDARTQIDAIRSKVDPLPLYYTTASQRTIERVNNYATVALIVVDDQQVVRLSERIDGFTSLDEPGVMVARITAAITSR